MGASGEIGRRHDRRPSLRPRRGRTITLTNTPEPQRSQRPPRSTYFFGTSEAPHAFNEMARMAELREPLAESPIPAPGLGEGISPPAHLEDGLPSPHPMAIAWEGDPPTPRPPRPDRRSNRRFLPGPLE